MPKFTRTKQFVQNHRPKITAAAGLATGSALTYTLIHIVGRTKCVLSPEQVTAMLNDPETGVKFKLVCETVLVTVQPSA